MVVGLSRRLQATARRRFCAVLDALDAPCLTQFVNPQ